MITRVAVAGYRSLRDITLELGQLTVITGANGSGKSSLYRALRLLADIAQGRIVQSLAAEGGLPSTLWAGPETLSRAMKSGALPVQGLVRKKPVSLKLGFRATTMGMRSISVIAKAADRSQVIVVSHAQALVSALEGRSGSSQILLEKEPRRDPRPQRWSTVLVVACAMMRVPDPKREVRVYEEFAGSRVGVLRCAARSRGCIMSDSPLDFSLLTKSGLPTRTYVADDVIFREGDHAEELYVVQSGSVEIQAGHRVLAIIGPNEFFGDMALIDPAPRSATAIAATDVTLIPVSEKQFLKLAAETPSFALDLLRLYVRRLRARHGYY